MHTLDLELPEDESTLQISSLYSTLSGTLIAACLHHNAFSAISTLLKRGRVKNRTEPHACS
jgi:hypothetical protein